MHYHITLVIMLMYRKGESYINSEIIFPFCKKSIHLLDFFFFFFRLILVLDILTLKILSFVFEILNLDVSYMFIKELIP